MSSDNRSSLPLMAAGTAVGFLSGFVLSRYLSTLRNRFSLADQPARFAQQKARDCTRALRIEQVFEPSLLAGKRVLVTGTNRGIGLSLVKEATACGAHVIATCRKPSQALKDVGVNQIIEGIDVQKQESMATLVDAISSPVDIVINNAGYFMAERESILENTMDYDDEVKTIDICAVGPLRVTDALWSNGKIKQDGSAKIIFITSQGGSIEWRDVQCPNGGDYGHHMSKAAANMGAKLVANELKGKALVGILHPGFNRTDMTSKYSHIWDIEGAVEASVGAKRVFHEINILSSETSGAFINCEDGLEIPW